MKEIPSLALKIILAAITIIFAGLGLLRILPFDVSNPVMLTSLATLLLLRGAEYKNSRDKIGFYLTCTAAIFVYAVVVYVVLVSRI